MPDVGDFDRIGPLYPARRPRRAEERKRPETQERRRDRRQRRESGEEQSPPVHIDEYA